MGASMKKEAAQFYHSGRLVPRWQLTDSLDLQCALRTAARNKLTLF